MTTSPGTRTSGRRCTGPGWPTGGWWCWTTPPVKRKCDRYRRAGEGGALNSLGILYGQQRRYTEAVACYEHSLTLATGRACAARAGP
jgi:hypothetical protein